MLNDALRLAKLLRSLEFRTRISTSSLDRIDPDGSGLAGYVRETKEVSALGPKN
jgi:hypothetical protein